MLAATSSNTVYPYIICAYHQRVRSVPGHWERRLCLSETARLVGPDLMRKLQPPACTAVMPQTVISVGLLVLRHHDEARRSFVSNAGHEAQQVRDRKNFVHLPGVLGAFQKRCIRSCNMVFRRVQGRSAPQKFCLKYSGKLCINKRSKVRCRLLSTHQTRLGISAWPLTAPTS